MKKILQAGTLLGLTFGSLTAANWQLVEDWESYTADAYQGAEAIHALNPDFYVYTQGALNELNIVTGVEGIGGNNAAWYWFGENITSSQSWFTMALPSEVPVGETATFYFRVWGATNAGNYHILTSKVAADALPDGTALWDFMSTIIRVTGSSGVDLALQVHSGGYTPSTPPALDPITTWTEYWMVIYNNDSPDAGDGWELYKKGINDTEPTIVTFGGDNPYTRLAMRNKAVDSIKTFSLAQNSAPEGIEVWLIDDIYMTSGVSLTDPQAPSTSWCGMDPVEGIVDTGDWLGLIHVGLIEDGQPGWVYSYKLNQWVYILGCPEETGAWVYVVQ